MVPLVSMLTGFNCTSQIKFNIIINDNDNNNDNHNSYNDNNNDNKNVITITDYIKMYYLRIVHWKVFNYVYLT